MGAAEEEDAAQLHLQKCTYVKLIKPDASESSAKSNHGEWPLEG